jgi:hypothetical protein
MTPPADVLEYLWWINSHSRVMYKILYGDKDTFSLAFAAAGEPARHFGHLAKDYCSTAV